MSGMRDVKEQEKVDGNGQDESEKPMPSSEEEEVAIKKKYGGIVPKKPPLISKDHERAYFDSADWALGKQGAEKPKGPLEALRPKLQVLFNNFVFSWIWITPVSVRITLTFTYCQWVVWSHIIIFIC
ncbi:hypothetical protein HS088_TW13G00732 [Tripterygium wilfordii]|uniref:cAMP-regulated phosphoprotein 19-related protein n=1 Tax=Tripterygium wilfordii TaxID=458696 RepID=A0A7J7CUU4_TRIWF|nr:hypothetical protein HS088_TW13G00732 [Tripterygium wilfordii]